MACSPENKRTVVDGLHQRQQSKDREHCRTDYVPLSMTITSLILSLCRYIFTGRGCPDGLRGQKGRRMTQRGMDSFTREISSAKDREPTEKAIIKPYSNI